MLKVFSKVIQLYIQKWFSGKESTCNAGDAGSIPWRRKGQPAPIFLSGKSHGGASSWGDKELDATEHTNTHTHILFFRFLSIIGYYKILCYTISPCCLFCFTFEFFILYWGVADIVIISGEWWRDSAIHIHVSILSQTSLLSRLPHNTEQSSMCHAIGPCWLSILNIAVCTWSSQTP